MKAIDRLKKRLKEKIPTLDLSKMNDAFLEKKLRKDKKLMKETQMSMFSFHGVQP